MIIVNDKILSMTPIQARSLIDRKYKECKLDQLLLIKRFKPFDETVKCQNDFDYDEGLLNFIFFSFSSFNLKKENEKSIPYLTLLCSNELKILEENRFKKTHAISSVIALESIRRKLTNLDKTACHLSIPQNQWLRRLMVAASLILIVTFLLFSFANLPYLAMGLASVLVAFLIINYLSQSYKETILNKEVKLKGEANTHLTTLEKGVGIIDVQISRDFTFKLNSEKCNSSEKSVLIERIDRGNRAPVFNCKFPAEKLYNYYRSLNIFKSKKTDGINEGTAKLDFGQKRTLA